MFRKSGLIIITSMLLITIVFGYAPRKVSTKTAVSLDPIAGPHAPLPVPDSVPVVSGP